MDERRKGYEPIVNPGLDVEGHEAQEGTRDREKAVYASIFTARTVMAVITGEEWDKGE